jgi:DNA (cytosine-5)-methyltransferase 1
VIKQLDFLNGSNKATDANVEHRPLRVAGLFAGIAGVELGMADNEHRTAFFSELDPAAAAVLNARFPGVQVVPDVRDVTDLRDIDLVAAGFPCQDLSQAGRTAGINGSRSGLVGEVLRLVREHDPQWLLLENVPFMLSLDRGRGMLQLTTWLTHLGFAWAYRVVDTRAFGLPQRRQRVLLLASRSHDPRDVLFIDDAGQPPEEPKAGAFGFYWTEGNRGLGWAHDAVPTLKAGSTIGIPSPPGIWIPASGEIGTPDIRDAERLQGFPAGWTEPALDAVGRKGVRWRLVGNAVSVPVTKWIGRRLRRPGRYDPSFDPVLTNRDRWPRAAWSIHGPVHRAPVSDWPLAEPRPPLLDFLEHPLKPLSRRATAGFFKRASNSTLRFAPGFLAAVEKHLRRMEQPLSVD